MRILNREDDDGIGEDLSNGGVGPVSCVGSSLRDVSLEGRTFLSHNDIGVGYRWIFEAGGWNDSLWGSNALIHPCAGQGKEQKKDNCIAWPA